MKRDTTLHSDAGEDTQAIAEDAYIFAYPILVMDVLRRIHTSVAFASPHGAPANQFAHARVLPGAHDKERTHPHADSLSSVAWVDLSKGPVVLSVPATDHYYLLPVYNGWFDLESVISSRTAGEDERHFGLVGPHWPGRLPDGIQRMSCTTEVVWINGRSQAEGKDIEAVHRLQDRFRLTPLSDWGKPATSHSHPFLPNVDSKVSAQEQVFKWDAATFFSRLSKLMRRIPRQVCDAPMVKRLSRIGMLQGPDFAFENLEEETSQALHAALPAAQLKIAGADDAAERRLTSHWSIHVHPGRYETRYLERAVAVRQGLVSAPAEDVLCFHTRVDKAGQPLKGANRYVVHFDHNRIPPVNAFWSLTLYNAKHHLAANPINRHLIGGMDRLRIHSDNSLSIYVQHEWPGVDKDSNWLPAPGDAFELVLQLYWPKPGVLQGKWQPPAVVRVI